MADREPPVAESEPVFVLRASATAAVLTLERHAIACALAGDMDEAGRASEAWEAFKRWQQVDAPAHEEGSAHG